MSLPKSLYFDKRIQERNLRLGIISAKDLEKHLSSLPDLSYKADRINIDKEMAETEAFLASRREAAAKKAQEDEARSLDYYDEDSELED